MNGLFLLALMLFCHIADDYYLQGFLASAKQKSWWEKNNPDPLYKYDYQTALIEHAFSWAFMTHLPMFVSFWASGLECTKSVQMKFVGLFIIMWFIHYIVDDLKANRHMINLQTDQLIHVVQVCLMFNFYQYFIL